MIIIIREGAWRTSRSSLLGEVWVWDKKANEDGYLKMFKQIINDLKAVNMKRDSIIVDQDWNLQFKESKLFWYTFGIRKEWISIRLNSIRISDSENSENEFYFQKL